MTIQTFSFLVPPVVFGVRTAESISEHLIRMGAKQILVISDRGLEKAGLVEQLCAWIRKADVSVTTYTDIEAEPSVHSVRKCVDFARQAGSDLVVGIGGGSVMDSTKVVAALLGSPGDILDYLGLNKVPSKGVPTILLPTTAGSGSEMSRGALFYVPERQSKEAVFSSNLLTDLALIDPALALSAPASVTAASGLDALCHAIESYTGLAANPLSMPFAELGIKWISQYLVPVVTNGSSLESREGMALGCLYASIALANANTHAVHALAYPLQGKNRIVHGRANGVLLPYVLNAIAPDLSEKLNDIAAWMGLAKGFSVSEGVTSLSRQIGLPTKMSALGVADSQLDRFTQEAIQIRRLLDNCPVPLDAAQIKAIYQTAL